MSRLILFLAIAIVIELCTLRVFRQLISNNKALWIGYLLLAIGMPFLLSYLGGKFEDSRDKGMTYLHWMLSLFVLWYVPKIFLALPIIGEEISRFFQWIFGNFNSDQVSSRRKFISQIGAVLGAIPLAAIVYGIWKGKYDYRVIKSKIPFKDIPDGLDGLRVLQISDIHSGSFDNPEKVQYGIDLINQQDADIFVFTGDLVNASADEMDPWIEIFSKIKKFPLGNYSILGNHDYGYYVRNSTEEDLKKHWIKLEATHKKIGWELLRNQNKILSKNGVDFALIGVENWGSSRHFPKKGNLKIASEGVNDSLFKILLSHDPSHFDFKEMEIRDRNKDDPEYNQSEKPIIDFEKKIHLTLAGHTHGMQFGIEIPGLFKWSPVKYRYPKWAGLYEEKGKKLYVNRGFGYLAFPGRVGMWPEISILELKKDNAMSIEEVLKVEGVTLIDVRNPDELEDYGSIEGAINIPLPQIPHNEEKIAAMSKPIILFCRSGNRSGQAVQFLTSKGIENLHNGGGYEDMVEIMNK